MANALSAVELAIYATLAVPVLYILARHSKAGILGWLYLFFFCTLRIIAGAMSMRSDSPTASTISNIGLSPLLLSASGILHEGRAYRGLKNAKLEWILVIFFHLHVVTAVTLLASGLSGAHINLSLVYAGIALLLLAWLGLCAWTVTSFLPGQQDRRSRAHADGTKIVQAVALALLFVGIRILYTLVALVSQAAYLSPVNGSLAIRLVLAFLPELVAALILITVGWQTPRAPGITNKEMGEVTYATAL